MKKIMYAAGKKSSRCLSIRHRSLKALDSACHVTCSLLALLIVILKVFMPHLVKNILKYVLQRHNYRKRERDRERSSIQCFVPKMKQASNLELQRQDCHVALDSGCVLVSKAYMLAEQKRCIL